MAQDYKQIPAPGDTISCPKCGAIGGAGGEIRVRGVMTDKQYQDRRCNSCGHLWTVGDSLELPFKAHKLTTTPANASESYQVPIKPGSTLDDDFEEEEPGVPF